MPEFSSDFLNVLSARGYIHQCSDTASLDALASRNEVNAYIGFDCTARSLHVGSLVQIMLLYWAQQTGQKPIALMGGGTTRVGDPSGRDEGRKLLSLEKIEENKRGIQSVFAKFLRFGDGPGEALMIDNAEWLTRLNYIEMLRDIGRHFSINRMLTMDSVKLRLEREQEMSFIEFNYMILQSYDFVELARRYGTNLQMGGSDQWGNIVTGVDLGRRMGTHQLFALTTPLITLASGAKMGKTASGAVWLNEDMLSSYEYSQFWRNTADEDVGRFLKLFTTLPLEEISKLEQLRGSETNVAKEILAEKATELLHGKDKALLAKETARQTFDEGILSISLPKYEIVLGQTGVLEANVTANFVSSNSEARRGIRNGAVRINDQVVSDETLILGKEHLQDGVIKLSYGRKKHVLLVPK